MIDLIFCKDSKTACCLHTPGRHAYKHTLTVIFMTQRKLCHDINYDLWRKLLRECYVNREPHC